MHEEAGSLLQQTDMQPPLLLARGVHGCWPVPACAIDMACITWRGGHSNPWSSGQKQAVLFTSIAITHQLPNDHSSSPLLYAHTHSQETGSTSVGLCGCSTLH